MEFLTLNEEFTPLTFGIADKDGNAVFGELPHSRENVIEYEYSLNGKYYRIAASFAAKTERQQAAFAMAIKVASSMTVDRFMMPSCCNFYGLHSLLLEVLRAEVSDGIIIPEKDDPRKTAIVSANQKGFLACISFLCVYMHRIGARVTLDYEQELNGFYVSVTAKGVKEKIPQVVFDYCAEVARTSGFHITFEAADDEIKALAYLRKDVLRTVELSANSYAFDFTEIFHAISLFMRIREKEKEILK